MESTTLPDSPAEPSPPPDPRRPATSTVHSTQVRPTAHQTLRLRSDRPAQSQVAHRTVPQTDWASSQRMLPPEWELLGPLRERRICRASPRDYSLGQQARLAYCRSRLSPPAGRDPGTHRRVWTVPPPGSAPLIPAALQDLLVQPDPSQVESCLGPGNCPLGFLRPKQCLQGRLRRGAMLPCSRSPRLRHR